ncbi:MAG TPA: hypothetical protein VMY41_09080 [Thermohalobaculum sp.]|nr:hypothetical protein [Thermohalobaculum sp.]
MSNGPTVRRSRGGSSRATGILVVAALGVVELAIIAVLIVLPMLTRGSVEVWQIALCAILLTATSAVFVATCFVRTDGKWRWRWADR